MWPMSHSDPNVFRTAGGSFSERRSNKLSGHGFAKDLPERERVSWRRARIYDAMKLRGVGLRHRRRNMFGLRGTVREMEARIAGPGSIQVKGYRTRGGKTVRSYRRSR